MSQAGDGAGTAGASEQPARGAAKQTAQKRGTVAGFSAYALWGIFPLVFRLLDEVSAVEILFHRIAWSLVVVLAVLAVQRRFPELRVLIRSRRSLRVLALAAVFI